MRREVLSQVKSGKSVDQVIKEARKNTPEIYLEKGIVKLDIGSMWMYMHEDWLKRGISEGALAHNTYNQVVPVARMIMDDVKVGMHGRKAIYERKEVMSMVIFNNFYERYEAYRHALDKENQANASLAK